MIPLGVTIKSVDGSELGRQQINQFPAIIGSKPPAHIQLKGWRIAAHHCQLNWQHPTLTLVCHPKFRCRLNQNAVSGTQLLQPQDTLDIGSYRLVLDWVVPEDSVDPITAPMNTLSSQSVPDPDTDIGPELPRSLNLLNTAVTEEYRSWQIHFRQLLLSAFDLKRINIDNMDDSALRQEAVSHLNSLLSQTDDLPNSIDPRMLADDVVNEVVGLGPLETLLAHPDVTEIMVNGPESIFYEVGGKITKSAVTFSNVQALMAAIERIVQPLGRRIDEASPMVDARLKDGSRVNAIIPPLSLSGPSLTIRKFSKERLQIDNLIGFDAISPEMAIFLKAIVQFKRNILISGGTGSGKTTLLNILSAYIPDHERIITIEDAAELSLQQPNLVSLEARPSNSEGKGVVTIRDLVRNSLRMRPDRIVIGECRGSEALDMLQAMNTGHAGSLSTAHANTPRDCLSRLEVMVLMTGLDIPITAIREQISSAIHFVIQQTRFPCGSRKITAISEIGGLEQGVIQLTDIFTFRTTGFDADGRVQGRFSATGIVPDFIEQQRRQGVHIDTDLFCGGLS